MCATFHENTIALSTEYESKLKRVNYVTPTSYLELIKAFKDSLGVQRELISSQKKRYDNGLQQLAFATESVNKMSEELTALQPVLVEKQEETAALMVEIEAKLPGVEEQKAVVGADAAVAQLHHLLLLFVQHAGLAHQLSVNVDRRHVVHHHRNAVARAIVQHMIE